MLSESYYVKTGIDRRNSNTKSGSQSKVSAAQLIDIDLRYVAQVEQHMRSAFAPTGYINASGDHMDMFAALS